MEASELYSELLFGSGSWLGLLLILTLIVGLMLKWKYAGLLILPVSIFLGMEYLDNGLGWQALTLLMSSPFILYGITQRKK